MSNSILDPTSNSILDPMSNSKFNQMSIEIWSSLHQICNQLQTESQIKSQTQAVFNSNSVLLFESEILSQIPSSSPCLPKQNFSL